MGEKKGRRKAPPEVWERRAGETPLQYSRFCAYRDMNTTTKPLRARSIARLCKELGTSYRYWSELATKHKWVARAAEYDLHLEAQIREKAEEELVEMRKNHAAVGFQMVRKATKRLLTLGEEEITAADIVRMVDVGVKIERLSRGEPTEIAKQEHILPTIVEVSTYDNGAENPSPAAPGADQSVEK